MALRMKQNILTENSFVVLSKNEKEFSIDQSEITKIIKKENITLFFFKKILPAVLIISKKTENKALATGSFIKSINDILKSKNDKELEKYCENNIISLSPEIDIFGYFDNLKSKYEKIFMKSLKKEFFETWANSDSLNFSVSSDGNDHLNFTSIGDLSKNIEEQKDYSSSGNSFNDYFIDEKIPYDIRNIFDLSEHFNIPSGFKFYISSNEFYKLEEKHRERRHGMQTSEFISLITKPFIINIGLLHKSTKTIIPCLSVETKMGFDTFYKSIIKSDDNDYYSNSYNKFPSKPKEILKLLMFYQLSLFINDIEYDKSLNWAKIHFADKKSTIEERVKRISKINAKEAFCNQLNNLVGKKD
jgi:hypothetical protein